MSIVDRLQKLKDDESRLSGELAKLTGRRDQLLDQLKSDFDLENLDEAKSKLEVMLKDIKRREERAERLLTELEGIANGA